MPSDDESSDDYNYSENSESGGKEDTPENVSDNQESEHVLNKERNEKVEDNTGEIDPNIILSWTFDTIDDAEDFYYAYAHLVGFKVRKQSMKIRRTSIVRYREFVCSCEGFKKPSEKCKRRPRPDKRCGCKARFRVAHDRERQIYHVTNFETSHNHETGNLKRNRYLAPSDKLFLAETTDVGIEPCKVLKYLEEIAGGPGKLSFEWKDAYNYLGKRRKDMIRGGDVNTAIGLLEGMKVNDKGFQYEYTTNLDGTLRCLFWCDSMSKAEFDSFGDVMCMDSTYKTNEYHFPLILFTGVDNHYNSCLFGAAVMCDETIPSYRWLLRMFRKAMNGKIPHTVLTDEDASMAAAILAEWPGAIHRLCSWHLLQNAKRHVKSSDFISDFGSILKRRCSEEEFELQWFQIIEKNELLDNDWVSRVYKKRKYWADAYFEGVFFAGMRSTQRSESMNACIKINLNHKLNLYQVVKKCNRSMQRMRSVFIKKQEDAEKEKPSVTKGALEHLEKHAANICTKKIFQLVSDQIRAEQGLVADSSTATKYSDSHYKFDIYPYDEMEGKCSVVEINLDECIFKCSCGMLDFLGVPCCHIICAFKSISSFKSIRITSFPRNSIHPRWTIEAGRDLKNAFPLPLPESEPFRVRFGQFQKEWTNGCYTLAKDGSKYDKNLEKVKTFAAENEEMSNNDSNDECFEEKDLNTAGARKRKACQSVGDPVKVISRGAGRGKQQKCGLCSVAGHKKGSCPQNPMNKNKQTRHSTRGRGRQNAQGRGRQNSPGPRGRMDKRTTNNRNDSESYHPSPLREQQVESDAYGYNPNEPSWYQEFYDNIF